MIAIMAYVALLSACLAAAAVASESVCRALRLPTRWSWAAGLALSLGLTVVVMLAPLPVGELPATLTTAASSAAIEIREVREPVIPPAVWQQAGLAATVVWVGASVVLLGLLAAGAATLMRERRVAGRSVVHGHEVLLTDGVGPAVAGFAKPVALIPRWVLEMDDASQRLLLAHEMEHVRARDSVVLAWGAVVAALLPWNPLVWWMLRRLRLAVEMDCDRRVLSHEASVRRYAELLLMTARIPSEHARLLVAGLGEIESDLERRIVAMTEQTPRRWLKRAVVPGALAGVLVVVACETPRPDPVAPSAGAVGQQPALAAADSEREVLVERPTELGDIGTRLRRLEGTIGEATGALERLDDVLVAYAELRKRLPLMQVVGLELEASIERLLGRPDGPRTVPGESGAASALPLDILWVSSEGRTIASEHYDAPVAVAPRLSRLDPSKVQSVEVQKQIACLSRNPARSDGGCNQITVTLKSGVRLPAYRRTP
jgi:beta-lactamase regulating signal transducer with metallopeptidase domain